MELKAQSTTVRVSSRIKGEQQALQSEHRGQRHAGHSVHWLELGDARGFSNTAREIAPISLKLGGSAPVKKKKKEIFVCNTCW